MHEQPSIAPPLLSRRIQVEDFGNASLKPPAHRGSIQRAQEQEHEQEETSNISLLPEVQEPQEQQQQEDGSLDPKLKFVKRTELHKPDGSKTVTEEYIHPETGKKTTIVSNYAAPKQKQAAAAVAATRNSSSTHASTAMPTPEDEDEDANSSKPRFFSKRLFSVRRR